MSVRSEIYNFLATKLKDLSTKARDIDLILYYYGFGDKIWPTYEEVASAFNVGDAESESRKAERPRQIINKFRSGVQLTSLPSLEKFLSLLIKSEIHFSSDLISSCEANGLIDDQSNLIGLLRILHELNLAENYTAYTLDLDDLTRSSNVKVTDFLIAESTKVKGLKDSLLKAKKISRSLGIAKTEYFISDLQKSEVETDIFISILKKNPRLWFYSCDNNDYYLFENDSNILVNSLEKIRSITQYVNIDVLTEVLSHSLRRTSPSSGLDYPPNEVIKRYLLNSRFTKIIDEFLEIKVSKTELTPIELDIVRFMQNLAFTNSQEISSFLSSLGYKSPVINKSIYHSPLIYIDKNGGQRNYKFRLVGKQSDSSTNIGQTSRYESFRQRLLEVSSNGTDKTSEANLRKEQYILSEWLFKDKAHEKCAICNNLYSVKSLVTAHKKKRADCADNERTDPYIVMPLCSFGCDYIYENNLVYIDKGIVRVAELRVGTYHQEMNLIRLVEGKPLDKRWVKGPEHYFKKPMNNNNPS